MYEVLMGADLENDKCCALCFVAKDYDALPSLIRLATNNGYEILIRKGSEVETINVNAIYQGL